MQVSCKKKCCYFQNIRESNTIDVPAGAWSMPLGNSAIFRAKDWSLLCQIRFLGVATKRSTTYIHHYFGYCFAITLLGIYSLTHSFIHS